MSITKSDIEFLMKHFNDLVEYSNKQSEVIQQLKEDNTLMKLFLEDLVKWNSHGYVGAKEILDKLKLRQKEQGA